MNTINQYNLDSYSKISVQEMENLAIQGGLHSGCDISLIKRYLLSASSILEVGACYGRVLNHLLNIGFTGDITAVEYSKDFCAHLREKFANRVNIIEGNLLEANFTKKFDRILLLWSGISDFAKNEQTKILKYLHNLLTKDGMLFFDSFPAVINPMKSTKVGEQEYLMDVNGKQFRGYFPTIEEIKHYGLLLQVKESKSIKYKTEKDRPRLMHIFSKS